MNSTDLEAEIRAIRLYDNRYGDLRITELDRPKLVADAMQVFVLTDNALLPRAVLHCSPPQEPDAVQHAVQCARLVKSRLNARAGALVLDVLTQGRVAGLSYSVSPFCTGFSGKRPLNWLQRKLLTPHLFDWLLEVAACTLSTVEDDCKEQAFVQPLSRLAALEGVGSALRLHVARAMERLGSGAWQPKYVLMHGDLWKGNVLFRPRAQSLEWWPNRAVIIDWAASQVSGYAIYDLVRLAESINLPASSLRRELERHCQLLQCELSDTRSYLVAALAYFLGHLGCFQLERYLELTEDCLETLDRALAL